MLFVLLCYIINMIDYITINICYITNICYISTNLFLLFIHYII